MNNDTPDMFDEPIDAGAPPPTVPPPPSIFAESGDNSSLPLAGYAERAYLSYAMSVVRARALPQVEDGLKPVQRRILHAMNEMRLAASAKHVKSARVVGDVIGKYHPHGDTSVYDAMVRVAQDFTLRYPLVDGQGNFGSRDGDGAAAMRYTECRLTPFAELLLAEIDRGTVDFTANYDGSMTEPQLMPARLPVVLLNGASGIAVGMATEIPPHNLREVAEAARLLIKKPEAMLEEVLALLPGAGFSRRRTAHLDARRHPRRLCRRPRVLAHACPLAHRGTGAGPVARDCVRIAAWRFGSPGTVGNRSPDQPAAACRQEGYQPGTEEPEGAGYWACWTACVTSPATSRRCASCWSQKIRAWRRTNSWPYCWRIPAWRPAFP